MGQYYAKELRAQHDEALTPQGRDHESHRPWHALEPRETSRLTAIVACAGTTTKDTGPPFICAEGDEIVQCSGHAANQSTTQGACLAIVEQFAPAPGPSSAACLMILHDTGSWPCAAPGLTFAEEDRNPPSHPR